MEKMRIAKKCLKNAKFKKNLLGTQYLGAEKVVWDEYHLRYVTRDAEARTQWREVVKKASRAADDLFAVDIIRRGLRHGDQILQ